MSVNAFVYISGNQIESVVKEIAIELFMECISMKRHYADGIVVGAVGVGAVGVAAVGVGVI